MRIVEVADNVMVLKVAALPPMQRDDRAEDQVAVRVVDDDLRRLELARRRRRA